MKVVDVASIIFVVTLLLQLCATIRLDIFSISHNSASVFGWLICFLLACVHIALGLSNRRVILLASLSILVFCMHTGLRIALTSGGNFTVGGILISPRFGLISLVIIGAGFALSLQRFQRYFSGLRTYGVITFLMRVTTLVTPLPLVLVCVSYLREPVISENYQAITNFSIIFFAVQMLMLEVAWPGRKPPYVQAFFGAGLTFCVAVIALIGSTGIVAFWLCAVALFYSRSFSAASGTEKVVGFVIFLVALWTLMILPFFQDVIATSRLQPLLEGSLEVTSITSRASLLQTFFEQFSVNPLLGDFSADTRIGLPEGSYIHSLGLSVLTHTGTIGFILFLITLVAIVIPRIGVLAGTDILAFRLAVILTTLGTLYTFFTWPPFWFFLGFLCIKPIYQIEIS